MDGEVFVAFQPVKMSTTEKVVPHNVSSSCRLCGAVVDHHYCKNIFNERNSFFLSAAEEICGSPLARLEKFSRLLCRPCERRLTNFKSFHQVIRASQTSVEMRLKRVIEMSPSAPVVVKSLKTHNDKGPSTASTKKARRGLNLNVPAMNTQAEQGVQRQAVSV